MASNAESNKQFFSGQVIVQHNLLKNIYIESLNNNDHFNDNSINNEDYNRNDTLNYKDNESIY